MNDAVTAPTHSSSDGPPSASQPRALVLVGMMGSGKTTVGRLVAARLGRPYLDNDDLVRTITGEEPAAIRSSQGEIVLHDFEATALDQALAGDEHVVASAAAAVVEEAPSREALDNADVVWLRARPETLSARIGSGLGRRDEATDPEWLAGRAHSRQRLYADVADLIIDVDDLSPNAIADEIVGWIANREAEAQGA
jgi:shikimate kinase